MGETVVEGQLHREGGGGEPVCGDANGGFGNGDHRSDIGGVGVPDIRGSASDVERRIGGQDGGQGLDVAPLGAVDVGPASFRGRVGGEGGGGVPEPGASLQGENIAALPDELPGSLRRLDVVEQVVETVDVSNLSENHFLSAISTGIGIFSAWSVDKRITLLSRLSASGPTYQVSL